MEPMIEMVDDMNAVIIKSKEIPVRPKMDLNAVIIKSTAIKEVPDRSMFMRPLILEEFNRYSSEDPVKVSKKYYWSTRCPPEPRIPKTDITYYSLLRQVQDVEYHTKKIKEIQTELQVAAAQSDVHTKRLMDYPPLPRVSQDSRCMYTADAELRTTTSAVAAIETRTYYLARSSAGSGPS
jgi:hypothetical protein